MDVVNFFFPPRPAKQIFFVQERQIILQQKAQPAKTTVFSDLELNELAKIKNQLQHALSAVFLNSNNFIFHILQLEKRPFLEKKRNDYLNWLLQKSFPENLEHYARSFMKIHSNKYLSVLIKKERLQKIEELFSELDISLNQIGSIFIEVLNWSLKKVDLLIETGKDYALFAFLKSGKPFYLRKFMISSPNDVLEEINKTATFLKEDNNFQLQTFFHLNDEENPQLRVALEENGLKSIRPHQSRLASLFQLKKHHLNFASFVKTNLLHSLFTLTPFFISLLLLVAGNFWQFKQIAKKWEILAGKSLKSQQETVNDLRQKIEINKKHWNPRLLALNSLILNKANPLLTYLDKLEETMPEGVIVESLKFAANIPYSLELTVQSPNSQEMIKLYQKWQRFNLTINKESEKGGVLISEVSLSFKNNE